MADTRVPGRRIVVIGSSGSGKTTLARELAMRLGVPHIEADALYWGPNWTPAQPDEFRRRVDQATAGDRWAFDGNYSVVHRLVWSRADTVIWLDYPLGIILWRLLRRSVRRSVLGEELWNGNRESLWKHLLPRDSLFYWVLTTHRRRRQRYEATLQQPEYAHLRFIRLRSPRDTAKWLASVPTTATLREDAGASTSS